jgi:hypothetical protein
MNAGIRVKDLRDQLGQSDTRAVLYCETCGEMESAHRGDYWALPPDYLFLHCGEPMRRVTERRILEDA